MDERTEQKMIYYLVAVMSIIHVDATRDVYLFDNSFSSIDECEYYHAFNVARINDFLVREYNYSQSVHQIFCVDEESLKDWIENNAYDRKEGFAL